MTEKHQNSSTGKELLNSATSLTGLFSSTDSILAWLKTWATRSELNVKQVALADLYCWEFSSDDGNFRHETGRFFSIDGLRVTTNWSAVQHWDQPIINQPEIGHLGILTKEFQGTLYFLMQAKVEPGNINRAQLSPTLQATRSNYSRVHHGRAIPYLEYFANLEAHEVIVDQLQSEQGSRFREKRNRNTIIKVTGDVPVHSGFKWMTLGQIKTLLKLDNVVNMDTRSVISGIAYHQYIQSPSQQDRFFASELTKYASIEAINSLFGYGQSVNTTSEILSWLTQLKIESKLQRDPLPLLELKGWVLTPEIIRHQDNKFFDVIGIEIEVNDREVESWSQPIVRPKQEGICAFICQKIEGVIHFLVQAKLEVGNFDVLELAPTVQCLNANYKVVDPPPFLDIVTSAPEGNIHYDTMQSEEGGDFFENKTAI